MGWEAEDRFLFKFDVEGHERETIMGAAELRRRADHAIFFEDWAKVNFPQVAWLLDEKYELFYVTKSGTFERLLSVQAAHAAIGRDRTVSHGRNFVAAKPSGAFAARLRLLEARR